MDTSDGLEGRGRVQCRGHKHCRLRGQPCRPSPNPVTHHGQSLLSLDLLCRQQTLRRRLHSRRLGRGRGAQPPRSLVALRQAPGLVLRVPFWFSRRAGAAIVNWCEWARVSPATTRPAQYNRVCSSAPPRTLKQAHTAPSHTVPRALTRHAPPRLALKRRLLRRGAILQPAGRGGCDALLLQRPQPLLRLKLEHLLRAQGTGRGAQGARLMAGSNARLFFSLFAEPARQPVQGLSAVCVVRMQALLGTSRVCPPSQHLDVFVLLLAPQRRRHHPPPVRQLVAERGQLGLPLCAHAGQARLEVVEGARKGLKASMKSADAPRTAKANVARSPGALSTLKP
jgi:hypothetical protein